MSDHVRRMLEHMKTETEALQLQAKRARLLDHDTNRGSEAEHGILHWLNERFAPEYVVSSGEIIDAYDTDSETESRQQDGVLHRNDSHARRFMLASGLRLIPVESVAALIEVKLSLTKTEFTKADKAATETAKLRYALQSGSSVPTNTFTTTPILDDENKNGVPMADPHMNEVRPTFAVFGYDGTVNPETLAEWLEEAQTVSVVCCLGAGFAARAFTWHSRDQLPASARFSHVAQAEHALVSFAERIGAATSRHANWYKSSRIDSERYSRAALLPYWDETGYEWHSYFQPLNEQVQNREQLFAQRPELRKKTKSATSRAGNSSPTAAPKGDPQESATVEGAGNGPLGAAPSGSVKA
jgi:hypothetical protein